MNDADKDVNEWRVRGTFEKTQADYGETVIAIVTVNGKEVGVRCWKRDVRAIVSTLKRGDRVEVSGQLDGRRGGKNPDKLWTNIEAFTVAKLGAATAREPGGDDFDADAGF